MKKVFKNFLLMSVLLVSLLLIDSNTNISKVNATSSTVPANIKVENISDSSAQLTWSKVEGVYAYEIYQKSGDKYNLIKTINKI